MKTDKISLADLFEKQRRYLVPLFQRGYVWTLHDQLKPLWRDIAEQARFLASAPAVPGKHIRRHFLGAVVFNQVNPGVRHVPVSEVIDGQQRLTTLQILLAAFRDAAAPLENQFLTAKLKRLTENEGPYPEPSERFKVWPTNAFRDEFQGILTAGSVSEVRNRFPRVRQGRKWLPRPLLVDGYLFFHETITQFLKGVPIEEADEWGETDDLDAVILEVLGARTTAGESNSAPLDLGRAELLLETLTGHIQLVEISLEGEDDPQIIFETLNARGAPLKPSDLVRNFVFLFATRRGEDVSAIYERSWKEFDEAPATYPKSETKRFWKDSERQGRLRSTRLDLFLFHYITYRTASELKLSHIFQEFRDWWEDVESERVTSDELTTLRRSADTYRGLVVPDVKERLGTFAYRLKVLDTTTLYPLVLLLVERRSAILDADFYGILQDLESYLVRRAVCGLTPKNYNRVFLALLKSLVAAKRAPDRATVRAELLALEGDSAVWPDDALFERNWLYEPIYLRTKPTPKVRMILEALEAALYTSKQESVPLPDPLTHPLTIEHVMPQNGDEKVWPRPAKSDDGTWDLEAIQRRSQRLHSVGNLTLLTQPLNSAISNGPFAAKRKEITSKSVLQLNAYFQDFKDWDLWTEEAILARGRKLLEVAKTVWPHPGNV